MHVQSHISECCGEVNCVREMHPEYASDTAVFEEMGLLTHRWGREAGWWVLE